MTCTVPIVVNHWDKKRCSVQFKEQVNKGACYQLVASIMNGEPAVRVPEVAHTLMQEVLRMYPPVGIGQTREALEDVTLAGKLRIPKGTLVWVPHFAIHNAEFLWDEPRKFIPGGSHME